MAREILIASENLEQELDNNFDFNILELVFEIPEKNMATIFDEASDEMISIMQQLQQYNQIKTNQVLTQLYLTKFPYKKHLQTLNIQNKTVHDKQTHSIKNVIKPF